LDISAKIFTKLNNHILVCIDYYSINIWDFNSKILKSSLPCEVRTCNLFLIKLSEFQLIVTIDYKTLQIINI